MIKYLRDKITGRPADDLLLDGMPPIKKTHSQNSLNDIVSINTNSNSNDIISNDQTTSQVEKLNAGGGGITSGRRLICSSSPIVIPKKPPYSNPSPQSSSSYTSVGDQMSSIGETLLLQSHHESDDASFTSLPTLPLTSHQLEHSAARDRISVKNKRRQTAKEKLSTLRETDDNQINLFVSISADEQASSLSQIEAKVQPPPPPVVNLSDLDTARARLRDHSADRVLSTKPIVPSIQRSTSFKRPQETKLINQSIVKTEEDESVSRSSSQEHIYDNLDIFKHDTSDISSTNVTVKTRELSTLTTPRLRPVTMLVSTNHDQQTVNEFENVFNQLKKRGPIKTIQPKEEIIPPEEPVQLPPPLIYVEEIPASLPTENEPIAPSMISTAKIVEIPSVTQSPNRRKTVGGVHLQANNKVATTDNKPTLSWIDIAKQKQSKFQSISMEKHPHEESEQQVPALEPTIVSRKQVTILPNITMVKENTSEDIRSNRKSMFEPAITRRPSPSTTVANTHAVERDSIRALKTGNPNRINNLIQFFDK